MLRAALPVALVSLLESSIDPDFGWLYVALTAPVCAKRLPFLS
jgi:hypothetical protein